MTFFFSSEEGTTGAVLAQDPKELDFLEPLVGEFEAGETLNHFVPGENDQEYDTAKVSIRRERNAKNPAYHHLEESDGLEQGGEECYFEEEPKRLRNVGGSQNEDDVSLLVDVLDDDKAGDTKDETGLDATMVAFDIFKSVCDTFTAEEFKHWYDLYATDLFKPEITLGLKKCMEEQDPRLRRDFMYSKNLEFVPDMPVGRALYYGTYAEGLSVKNPDANFIKLTMVDRFPEGAKNFNEYIGESKIMNLCQHLYFKQLRDDGELDPCDYWFHSVIKLPTGTRYVVRAHCLVIERAIEGDVSSETRLIELQDVSHIYQDILNLPPLPL
mmetsp:Transcript_5226/g.9222  ORF Transcript_5226/g.9222 Transcript_5226/m.9222 type:complete len:327 (+) Transcript_5226:650-1630(+)